MTRARPAALAGWAVLVVLVAAWLALVEVLWLPLRVAGVLVPVSVPAAVVGNVLLVGWAHRLSRSRVVAVLPALVWLTIALAGTIRRPEGDLLLTGGGWLGVVGLGFLLLGAVAAALAVGRALGGPRAGRLSRRPAGSGSGGAR